MSASASGPSSESRLLKNLWTALFVLIAAAYPVAETLSHGTGTGWTHALVLFGYYALPLLLYLVLTVIPVDVAVGLLRLTGARLAGDRALPAVQDVAPGRLAGRPAPRRRLRGGQSPRSPGPGIPHRDPPPLFGGPGADDRLHGRPPFPGPDVGPVPGGAHGQGQRPEARPDPRRRRHARRRPPRTRTRAATSGPFAA